MALDTLKQLNVPVVRLGNGRVPCRVLTIEELPGQLPQVEIKTPPLGAAAPDPGARAVVRLGLHPPFAGKVESVRTYQSEAGSFETITLVPPGARLNVAVSAAFVNQPRQALLQAVLGLAGETLTAPGDSNETHKQLTLLSTSVAPVAARLSLLDGRVLLATLNGLVAVDPATPAGPVELNGEAFYHDRHRLPALRLLAPHPRHWARHRQVEARGPGPTVVGHLPEAASLTELRAAARAIRALERQGLSYLDGGPELLAVVPGTWFRVGGGTPLLATGRVREWHKETGWRVRLLGSYPWRELLARTAVASEPAEVTGFNAQTGRLKVRLPAHADLVIEACLRADAATAQRKKLTIPAVGDVGLVVFGYSADQALYVGAPAPYGYVSEDDFKNLVALLQTDKLTVRHQTDGTARSLFQQVQVDVEGEYHAQAKRFRHNRR